MTLIEFIAKNRITMTADWTDVNPAMPDFNGDNWKCLLKRPGARMTVYFSMGYGHNGKAPTAADVLECLASDCAGVEGNSFENWASDLGYDTGSRKAEKTFKVCERQAVRLEKFLGADEYQKLLYGLDEE